MTTLEEVFLKANGDIPDGTPKTEILDSKDEGFVQQVPGEHRGSSLNGGEEGKIEEENRLVKDESIGN